MAFLYLSFASEHNNAAANTAKNCVCSEFGVSECEDVKEIFTFKYKLFCSSPQGPLKHSANTAWKYSTH